MGWDKKGNKERNGRRGSEGEGRRMGREWTDGWSGRCVSVVAVGGTRLYELWQSSSLYVVPPKIASELPLRNTSSSSTFTFHPVHVLHISI